MHGLAQAKWSYVTRRVADRGAVMQGGFLREPRAGDLVVVRVVGLSAHESVEDVHGRGVRLYPGDLVIGALGNRYATNYYEGYLPTGAAAHLLTAGGLIGVVASAHACRAQPTELEVIGTLADQDGAALSLEDFAMASPPPARPELGTVVVVGSSMNAGKTTTAAAIVHGWTRAGLRVGAGKVTGSGSGKDRWMYIDAGAVAVTDFLDFGIPSTFGYPVERLRATMSAIRDALVADGADAVVLEIADGLLQEETRVLAEALPGFADGVVLAVSDAIGAVGGVAMLRDLGVSVRAVSGLVTASPLACREVTAATELDVLSPMELARGAAIDLLANRTVPV